MKKLFKHGNKRIIDIKLVKDAIRANVPIEDFEELIEVDSEGKLKEWMKGFGTGITTTVLGLAVGIAIGVVLNQVNRD
jgi:hypothetical protein